MFERDDISSVIINSTSESGNFCDITLCIMCGGGEEDTEKRTRHFFHSIFFQCSCEYIKVSVIIRYICRDISMTIYIYLRDILLTMMIVV